MNEAVEKWLADGNEITEIPFGVPRDMNICMNCKGLFETKVMSKGIRRKCPTCQKRNTKLKGSE